MLCVKIPEMEVLHGQSLQEMNCNAATVTSSIISWDNGDNAHGRIPTCAAGTANKHRHEPYYDSTYNHLRVFMQTKIYRMNLN